MTDDDQAAGLFDVPEMLDAARPGKPGRVEAGLTRALQAGEAAGILVPEDLGLIGSAMVGARALDAADRNPGPKTGYLVAALLTPYRETLAALRLPAALTPSDPRAPANADQDTPEWLRDAFGTPGGL